VAAQRYAGYCDALRSDGIEPVDRWTRRSVKASIREGMIGASTLLAQRPRPDGIVAYNDMLAVGAVQACKREGLRVPDAVAIVGVDDTDLAVVADPPLTSIRLHQFETGQHAMALLLSTLEGAAQSEATVMAQTPLPRPDLIVRRSSSARAGLMASPEEIDSLT
jgi:LacI family transcriptional regulator